MNAPDVLAHLQTVGVNLRLHGRNLVATPRAAVTPEIVTLLRSHKAELVAALASDTLPDPRAEVRRQRVLAMLADHAEARYALVTDLESDPETAIVALAIRGRATCEFHIPRDKYDGPLLLDLIERHGATVH